VTQATGICVNEPTTRPDADVGPLSRAERTRALGRELDALYARTLESLGAVDIAYIQRVRHGSLALEVLGRALLYASVFGSAFLGLHVVLGVLSFAVGVCALAAHKQLQWEIYHTVFHGAYDQLSDGRALRSQTARWDMPIDEAAWRRAHNARHHGATNVLGIDPDLELCTMRFSSEIPWRRRHRYQMLILFVLVAPLFTFALSSHLTGVSARLFGEGETERTHKPNSARECWRQALRKWLPYYAKNYVLFPALAGALFWKILLGNALAEVLRDVYSALTVVCGHMGEEQKSWPVGTRPNSRGEWYTMQLEATKNFEVSLPVSILCGGVDRHIEHHLFPRLPPNRLRQIAPEVRAACERHGFCYRTSTWGGSLAKAFRKLAVLARDPAPVAEPASGATP